MHTRWWRQFNWMDRSNILLDYRDSIDTVTYRIPARRFCHYLTHKPFLLFTVDTAFRCHRSYMDLLSRSLVWHSNFNKHCRLYWHFSRICHFRWSRGYNRPSYIFCRGRLCSILAFRCTLRHRLQRKFLARHFNNYDDLQHPRSRVHYHAELNPLQNWLDNCLWVILSELLTNPRWSSSFHLSESRVTIRHW